MTLRLKLYAALGVALLAGCVYYTHTVYKRGVEAERAASATKAIDRIKSRNADDEALRKLDETGLCIEFGATRWLPDEQRCE